MGHPLSIFTAEIVRVITVTGSFWLYTLLEKIGENLHFKEYLLIGVEWKSLTFQYDFHSTASTNINWNFNFRSFFLSVQFFNILLHNRCFLSMNVHSFRKTTIIDIPVNVITMQTGSRTTQSRTTQARTTQHRTTQPM